MKIEVAPRASPELVAALARLIPQLSRSNAPPSLGELEEIVGSPTTDLFLARDDAGTVIGTATLAVFRIPTARRAWIEDVVVDEAAGGQGVGTALVEAMLARARELHCTTVDLTSRPTREAANRLYERVGFQRRETNVWRYVVQDAGAV